MSLLDAVPCADSASCYAITQPKALNQGYVLSKNSSGVWYRNDSYKLMKQSAYSNQYLNVSDNVALYAIGILNSYYYSSTTGCQFSSLPQTYIYGQLGAIFYWDGVSIGSTSSTPYLVSGGYMYVYCALIMSQEMCDGGCTVTYSSLSRYTIVN